MNLLVYLTSCLLGVALAMSAPAVTAAGALTETGNFEKQWYLGAGLGRSHLKPDTGGSGYRVDDKHDTGYKVFAGYDFTERFSLEGYFSKLGKTKLSPDGKVKYKDFGMSGLYYFYKSQRPHVGWGVFGRAGLGQMKNNADINIDRDNENHIMFGTGVEYGFDNGLALRVDADFYDTDARFFAINVLKRFGVGKAVTKKKVAPQPVPTMDSDNDGIVNGEDRCPNSLIGAVVDSQGCERDADGDGVTDSADACLETVTGAEVDARGCEMDADNDGIADRVDRCPATSPGVNVNAQGCELKMTFVLKGVTFATASAELVGDSMKVLDEVRDTLQLHPEIKVELAGYTDSRGSWKYNVGLSQRRADVVRAYLIGQGIFADRLKAKGYGPDKPIADNATSVGRVLNRRVEMHILD